MGAKSFSLADYPLSSAEHVATAYEALESARDDGAVDDGHYAIACSAICEAAKSFDMQSVVVMDDGPDMTQDAVHVPSASAAKPATKRRRSRLRLTITHPTLGQIDVRHMRTTQLAQERHRMMRAAELSSASDAGDGAPVWIQLAKVGQFQGHPAGPFELSPQVFAEIVRNFRATQNRRVPVDFEHASEADATSGSIPTDGAPAQGWIVDLDNRGEAGLWGLVEWGQKARDYIRGGQYRYISPAMRFGSRDRVSGKPVGTRLTSAGLTNQPFLDGMDQLAASDRDAKEPTPETDSGQAPHTGEDINMEIQKQFETLSGEHAALQMKWGEVVRERDVLRAQLEASKAETAAAKAEATTLVAACKAAGDAEVKSLKDSIALRDEAELKSYVTETVVTYGDKLPVKDEATLLALCKSDSASFKKMFPRIAPANSHLLRDLTGGREKPATTSETKDVPSLQSLTDKFVKDGVDIAVAVNMAFKEHTKLTRLARA